MKCLLKSVLDAPIIDYFLDMNYYYKKYIGSPVFSVLTINKLYCFALIISHVVFLCSVYLLLHNSSVHKIDA